MRAALLGGAFAATAFAPATPVPRARLTAAPAPPSALPQRTQPVCRRPARQQSQRKASRALSSKKPGGGGGRAASSSKTARQFQTFERRSLPRVGPEVAGSGGGVRFSLESCPCLVLNADFQPLSYVPLSLWPWQETIKAVYSNRVTVVATYDVSVRSPSMIFQLPSVICLKKYQRTDHKPPFTRFNVFLRDNFSCQYCGVTLRTQDLTFDHVLPRCQGGKTNWTNVVTACPGCNHSKGRKLLKDLPNMKLAKKASAPTNAQLQNSARSFPPRHLHDSWVDYLYWNESMQLD